MKKPGKLKSPPERRNRDKYCRYHRDHGHDTEDSFRLKIAIEKLIEAVHLAEFVNNNRSARPDVRPPELQQPLGNINVVSGGTSGNRDSQSARKRYVCASRSDIAHVRPADHLPIDTLAFSSDDDPDLHYPHDDPLVVMFTIANYVVK